MKAEFIPDLLHISEDAIHILLSCKGEDNCFICTDSLSCAGLEDGFYTIGSVEEVLMRSGEIYTRDGATLAGSGIVLLEGVRRLVSIGV